MRNKKSRLFTEPRLEFCLWFRDTAVPQEQSWDKFTSPLGNPEHSMMENPEPNIMGNPEHRMIGNPEHNMYVDQMENLKHSDILQNRLVGDESSLGVTIENQ